MLFVGIDPSLTATGLVVLQDDNPEPVLARMCKTDKEARGLKRCGEIERILIGAIAEARELMEGVHNPIRVAIEHYSYASKFNVVGLVELGTTLRWALIRRGWEFIDPAPTQVKKFAGSKGPQKLKSHVEALWGYKAKNADIADAYVLAQIARASSTRVPNLTNDQRDVVLKCRTGHSEDRAKAA